MNIVSDILACAKAFPAHIALSVGKTAGLTYAQPGEHVARLAGGLIGQYRLAPGERVVIALENSPDYLLASYAVWMAGGVIAPVNVKLHAGEIDWIRQHCQARLVLASAKHAAQLAQLAKRARGEHDSEHNNEHDSKHNNAHASVIVPGDEAWQALLSPSSPSPGAALAQPVRTPADALAWLFYTSGTTGRPKGAMLSHRSLRAMVNAFLADYEALEPGDTWLHCAPLSHGSGLYGLAYAMRGGNQVIAESAHFDAAHTLELLAAWPRISTFVAPVMLRRLCASLRANRHERQHEQRPASLENIRSLIFGGAPMLFADLLDALNLFGARLAQLYGQGEAPMTIAGLSTAQYAELPGTGIGQASEAVGYPRTGVRVRTVDANGIETAPLTPGEIACQGDVLMSGYWRDEAASRAALAGGWLKTGDIGYFDDSGLLYVCDRSKDIIISGGTNIYPREVEEVLARHPAVDEVAVFGTPDAQWGESVVAVVKCRQAMTVTPAELDAWCLERIARFKRPKRYAFAAESPKSAYGKILRRELSTLISNPDGNENVIAQIAHTGQPDNRTIQRTG